MMIFPYRISLDVNLSGPVNPLELLTSVMAYLAGRPFPYGELQVSSVITVEPYDPEEPPEPEKP